jgi:ubiquinone/menaquinone biosynthesis C-methylase UbiE
MVFDKQYADAYDSLYQDKDYKKECDFIEAIFKKNKQKPKTILDLGCGTGGHALLLAKPGYEVVGIDRSEHMLKGAREKAKDQGLKIQFIKGDITNIDLKRKFDAVISMFAVMGYQITNKALHNACRTAHSHLKKNGIFIFDCWNGLAVLTEKPGIRVKEMQVSKNEKLVRFTEPVVRYLDHVVETRFKVWKMKDNSLVRETNEAHFMRFLFPQEIRYFLETAGFKNIEMCPFLDLNRELTEHDWNMCVIARK